MPFDGSGNFDRVHNFSADASAGIQAQAVRFDAELDGIATGLENCQTLTGETTPTADSPMGGFKHTGVAAATSAGNYLRSDQSSNQVGIYVRDVNTGVTGVMSASAAVFPTAFTDGQRVTVKVSADGSAVAPRAIIINGLSANIIDNEGSAMPATRMLKDETFDLIYDSSAVAFRAITDVKKIATLAEVSAGTDTLKIVTPATLKQTGTWTPTTYTGFSTDPTFVLHWEKIGKVVTVWHFSGNNFGTSDTATLIWTFSGGQPAAIDPTTSSAGNVPVIDNVVLIGGSIAINTSGLYTVRKADGAAWTASGTKGLQPGATFTYNMD